MIQAQGPFVLTWFNCNPNMDKYSPAQQSVGLNYLPIPKSSVV